MNELKNILENIGPQHIHKEANFSTKAFDGLKDAQRYYQFVLGEDISINKTFNLICAHYGQLLREGKIR